MGVERTRLASAVLLIASVAIGGCATMSEQECLTVDWRTIGYEDGVAGYSGDRIGLHRKACAKHGVTPDLASYQQGREAGLREYCVPANGFRLGAQGAKYHGLCPADLDGPFTTAYESGHHLYTLRARVEDAAYRLGAKRSELESIEKDIVRQSALAVSSDASADERAQAVVDVKRLAERSGRLKEEIQQLERDKAVFERDLEDYRATLAYRL
ncbi:MAG: DUF2799 domain-containing protein [Xanthomonadaceae bacterium]|nr:DUF2799 domain-containing protein [Xanthomonadaceae bacterium]